LTRRRVVVTGLGVVSALGNSIGEFWAGCLEGRTCVEAIPAHWSEYYTSKSRIWSPLRLPDYSEYGLKRADLLRYDAVVLNAVVAAEDALTDAGFEKHVADNRARTYRINGVNADRIGVFIGTGLGCISSAFNNYVPHLLGKAADALFARSEHSPNHIDELKQNLASFPRVSPFASVQSMANAIAAQLSLRYGTRGAAETLVYACAAGTVAIGRALRAIQHGEIDMAIVGGSEYYGDHAGGVFMAFDRLQTLAGSAEQPDRANRPFDENRSGFLFSQGGSGIIVLESEEHARARGAKCHAVIRGMSITSDANSLAAISEENNAIELMFNNLFRDSGLTANDIQYVNAHGTSTLQNDPIEAGILKRVFPSRPLVNSTKGLLGHTIGASGAIEFIVTILSMRDQRVHGSRNLDDPVVDLNYPRGARAAAIEFASTHSFGFGGHNAGLVLERLEG
jgi:3-oxoacyl-[acyl-carrier-protein] synthase II